MFGYCDVLQTLEHYDSISPDYVNLLDEKIDENRIWCQGEHKLPAFDQWVAQAKHFSHNKRGFVRLLDIGCGTGGFLHYARDHGFEVYGFDSSQAQIDYASRDLQNLRKAFHPVEYLEFLGAPDLRFDMVTLWDVLEHIRNPLESLCSIRSILNPNGLLFVSVPNGRAMLWKRKVYTVIGKRDDALWVPWEHAYYYSAKSLPAYLTKAGFTILKIGAVACYPRPISFFELIRRIGFKVTSYLPALSPQIYIWAQTPEKY